MKSMNLSWDISCCYNNLIIIMMIILLDYYHKRHLHGRNCITTNVEWFPSFYHTLGEGKGEYGLRL